MIKNEILVEETIGGKMAKNCVHIYMEAMVSPLSNVVIWFKGSKRVGNLNFKL